MGCKREGVGVDVRGGESGVKGRMEVRGGSGWGGGLAKNWRRERREERKMMFIYHWFCSCPSYVCTSVGDRAHIIENTHDVKKNERVQNQDFINLVEGI